MNYFFSQLIRSIGVFFRTLRAFVVRRLMNVTTFFRRLLNFSRHATKAAAVSLESVVTAGKKPTSEADYVETGHLYISKSLIVKVILIVVAAALIIYFVIWPFLLSRFFTAKFFVENKRVENWSGRVIVYSDKKKTIPMYSGRLEDGVLQGEGKLYDGEGLLTYEGQLKDGGRSGSGKAYQNGVLQYEGQFAADVYSGYGKSYDPDGFLSYDGQYENGKRSGSGTAYEGGVLLYDGQFKDDQYEGRGKLYEKGTLRYDGSFASGVREGSGTAYHLNGKTAYQGQYLAGKKDGNGTSYTEDGQKEYTGGFAEGEFSGEGTLYFENGGQLEGSFENGSPTGSVQWKKNGMLYYEGEWSDGAPSGFGTLYNKAGKTLYEGASSGGTIDGFSLREYTTSELRDALVNCGIKNEDDGVAFRVIAEEIGLTALCTYQSEDAESRPYQIYLYAPEKSDWVGIMPKMPHTNGVQWPEDAEPEQLKIHFIGQQGVNVAPGLYYAESYADDSQRLTVLYSDETREQTVLVTWENKSAIPSSGSSGNGGKSSESDAEKLIDALDEMLDSEGTMGSAGGGSGGTSSDAALTSVATASDAVELIDSMLDYWEETQRKDALEEIYELNETLISDEENKIAKGTGSSDALNLLKQEQSELETKIESVKTALKRAELQAETKGVTDLSGYSLEDLLVIFNPAEQDISGLVLFAATYYEGTTGEEANAASINSTVKSKLLDLSDAYSATQLAMSRYETLSERTESAKDDYAKGLSSKSSWYQAMKNQAEARIALYEAIADFSGQANHFNQMTGGWVSREFNWHRDALEELFRADILPDTLPEENGAPGETAEPGAAAEEPAETAGETGAVSTEAPEGTETPEPPAETPAGTETPETPEEIPAGTETPETPEETPAGTETPPDADTETPPAGNNWSVPGWGR